MRLILIFHAFLLLIANAASSQDSKSRNFFMLSGSVKGRDTGIIVLLYPDTSNRWIKDTAYLNKGQFEFKGFIKEPSLAHLIGSKRDGNYNDFFLESGKQQIFLEENAFENFKMVGSFSQNEADSLDLKYRTIAKKYKEWINEYNSLKEQLKTAKDSIERSAIKKKFSEIADRNQYIIGEEKLQETLSFISRHNDSYVSAVELNTLLTGRQIKTELADTLFQQFSQRIKISRSGGLIRDELYKRSIGIEVPNFSTQDYIGKNISLYAFRGKYILIDFWASWCIPCINQIPEMKAFLKKYNANGFEIICISIDIDKKKWLNAIKMHKIENFHHILVNEEIRSKYSNASQPIPSQILVNKHGIIVWNSMNETTSLGNILEKEFDK